MKFIQKIEDQQQRSIVNPTVQTTKDDSVRPYDEMILTPKT